MILGGDVHAGDVITVSVSNGGITLYKQLEEIGKIVRSTIDEFRDRLRGKDIDIRVDEDVIKLMCKQAFDEAKGEEEIRMLIKEIFEEAEKMFKVEKDKNERVVRGVLVTISDDNIDYDVKINTVNEVKEGAK